MTMAISTTILRVRDLVNDHHDWFEAIAAWYDCAKWTKKIFVDYLAARMTDLFATGRARA